MSSGTASKRTSSPKPTKEAEKKKDDVEKEVKPAKGMLQQPKTILTMVVVAVLAFVFYKTIGDKEKMRLALESGVAYVEAQGDRGLYIYLFFTWCGVVCLVPTTPMELAGGFLFSPRYGMWQTLFMTSGAKLVANLISVLLARHVFKQWVFDNVITKFELLQMVSEAVKDEPWKMAFLVRGSMLPLAVKNYGLGVMEIAYTPIALNSCIFTTFYAFQNIYMGSLLVDLKDIFSPKKASAAPGDWLSTCKSMAPVAFNVLLVLFLVKAVKGQIKKAKDKMETDMRIASKERKAAAAESKKDS